MATPQNKHFRVLLIEDEPADAELIRSILSEEPDSSFELLQTVDTLHAGLPIVDSGRADLVLLDLTLADSSGIETFRRVRRHAPYIPIIVLTGRDDDEISLKTLHEGAQDYLVKGRFNGHMLAKTMRYALERQNIEERFEREHSLLKSLVDNIPDYIYAKDLDGRYVIDNVAHYKQLRAASADDVIGKTVFDFFPPDLAAQYHTYDQAIMLSGKPLINHEEPGINGEGVPRWVATTKVPLHDSLGNITGLVCIGRDITEQRRAQENLLAANAALEQGKMELSGTLANLEIAHAELRDVQLQLIESEKMKSIGRLAAGVAHEVKNPLAVISMGIDYLSREPFSGDANIPTILREMSDAVKRADEVVRGLLDFSIPKQLEVQEADLNEIIEQALVLVRGEMQGEGYSLKKELRPDLPKLKLDPTKIGQVFINIFTNAIHSMEQGGTLLIRTEVMDGGESAEDATAFPGAGIIALAEVEDTGKGIPEEMLARIYDPFFTTKPSGKGSGLGLTVTKTIIDLHGGTIDIISNKPEGGVKVTVGFRV